MKQSILDFHSPSSRFALYLFPVAFLLNSSAMTILLISAGAFGRPELAVDIAIIQGVTLAVFFSFSANARSIILRDSAEISWVQVLNARLLLLAPICGATLLASLYLTDAALAVTFALVARRCAEWLSEVYLARREREGRSDAALTFAIVQVILLISAIAAIATDSPWGNVGLFAWALVPLILNVRFLKTHLRFQGLLESGWQNMLPHVGSTAITGVTVLIFRMLIVIFVDEVYAGNLFTAFAIGGILASVFTQALGPTLVLHGKDRAKSDVPSWLRVCLLGSAAVGFLILLGTATGESGLSVAGKPLYFWQAIGASLIGGAIMVLAQRYRYRLLQLYEDGNVFGPDVLTNVLIIACVPYVYYLLGYNAFSFLFLFNAMIALIFYFNAERTADPRKSLAFTDAPAVRTMVAAGLMFPVFFQLSGSIFKYQGSVFSSHGVLLDLPIPVSVLFCYAALAFFGRYARARRSLTVIFLSFCLMLLSVMMTTQGDVGLREGKVILQMQFILPMLALVLGQTFEDTPETIACISKGALLVVGFVVPLQLVSTWIHGFPILSSDLYAFSVYQHLQYVPLVLVCGYLIGCFSLWEDRRSRLFIICLGVFVGAYVVHSFSALAIGGLLLGATGLAFYVYRYDGDDVKRPALVLLLLIALGSYGATSAVERWTNDVGGSREGTRGAAVVEFASWRLDGGSSIASIAGIWRFHAEGIVDSQGTLAFGNRRPPDRKLFPSAYNYYLDFAYNFGIIALLPILWLLWITLRKSVHHIDEISENPGTVVLVSVIVYLLLVDNSFNVGLRQPYPGIFTFFLWGVLLSRLQRLDARGRAPVPKLHARIREEPQGERSYEAGA